MNSEPYEARFRNDYSALLREAGQFYMSQGDVYATLRDLARRLDAEYIPYALIGGMALAAHGWVRMTQDIDILMTAEGLAAFQQHLVGRGYAPAFPGAQRTFRDANTQVRIEINTTGEYSDDGKPKPVAFPEPRAASIQRDNLSVITLEKLVELKAASGMTAPHHLRDLADVQDVITALKLPMDLVERLDPSVRDTYRQLWQSAQAATET